MASGTLVLAGSGIASAAKSPIVIGYVSDLTGVASPNFADGPGGAQARIDLQNARGGVDGRKLKLVVEDDQSSPAINVTASQDLVENKGAFLVVNNSVFTFAAAKYLQQQGVPVVGSGFDGPEWTAPQNANMFTWVPPSVAPVDGRYYTYSYTGKILHDLGVTRYAGLAYGISPSSQVAITATLVAAKRYGIKQCYLNDSVPYGSADFTADALQIKTAGCNGVGSGMADAGVVALAGAVKHAGIAAQQLNSTGYDENVLNDVAAANALDGTYFESQINFTTPDAATQGMLNTMKKYDRAYKGGIPDYGLYTSYLATDLAIKGLQVAGKDLTRSAFITNLHKVANYNAGGILPSPTTFEHFGTPAMFPTTSCTYLVKLEGTRFVVQDANKPICGTRLSFPAS